MYHACITNQTTRVRRAINTERLQCIDKGARIRHINTPRTYAVRVVVEDKYAIRKRCRANEAPNNRQAKMDR